MRHDEPSDADSRVPEWVARLGAALRSRGWTLGVAESCTGGLLAAWVTSVPGSSEWFVGGIVSYANEAKVRLLGVDPGTLSAHGAVSAPVAEAMARGARQRLGVDVSAAVTGIAGPGGGTAEKPVGLVYIAVADRHGARVERHLFRGSRGEVRWQSTAAALAAVLFALESTEAD